MKISACLITLNEEANLRRALSSIAGLVDEIVIVDSGSADGTEAIAREFGARWVHQDWLGYVGQKNRAIELATHEWILSLDGDEELSAALREEIRALNDRCPPTADISGYSLPRVVYYEGKWIRHGDWFPDRLTRLFRKDRGRFAGGKVHERLEIEGRILPLTHELHHYSFANSDDHKKRCEKYARLWAESQAEQGRRASWLDAYTHALHRFIRAYILRLGFMDGALGYRIATYAAREVFQKYQLLHRLTGK